MRLLPARPGGALAVLLLLAAGCSSARAACVSEDLAGVRPGACITVPSERTAAPAVSVPRLDGSGELSLERFRGRVVVLNFWASWCAPCRREQPELNRVAERLPDDEVAFVGVNLQDTRPNARAHAQEYSIPYPSLFDPDSSFAARFRGVGPRSIPSTLLLDRQGRVAVRLFGETDSTELLVLIQELLGSSGPAPTPAPTGAA